MKLQTALWRYHGVMNGDNAAMHWPAHDVTDSTARDHAVLNGDNAVMMQWCYGQHNGGTMAL